MTSQTLCSRCGIGLAPNGDEKYLFCKKCNRYTAAGANASKSNHTKEVPKSIKVDFLKGGTTMKNTDKEKIADGVLDYLERESVTPADMTKVLSCAYKKANAKKPTEKKK